MNNTDLRLPNTPSPSHLYGCHFYFIQMSVRALSFSSRVPHRGGKWKRLCCIYTAEMFKKYVGRIQANIRGVHHQAPDLEEDVQKLQ